MKETNQLDAALQPLGSAAAAVKRLGHNEDALRWVLSRYWPASDGSDSSDMSALDCMVVIIRHICAHSDFLGTREFEDYVIDSEDAVLRLAMSDLTVDTPQLLSRVQKAREAAFKRIAKDLGNLVPFRVLIKSSSLWRLEQFRLYHPLTGRAAGSETWVDDPNESATSCAATSLLHWDMKVHATFQELIESKLGSYRDQAGSEFSRHCASPAFLRVRLVPKAIPDKKFSIDAVRMVALPRVSISEEKVRSAETEQWSTRIRPAGRDRYYLVAVVKLRQTKGDNDRVRLYDLQGNNVTPGGDLAHFDGVLDDNWSMREQSNTYLLFYCKAGPDIATQARETEEVHVDSVSSLERRDAQKISGLFKADAGVAKSFGRDGDDDDDEGDDENEILKNRRRKSDIVRRIRRKSKSAVAGEEDLTGQGSSGKPSFTEDPTKKESPPAAKKSKQSSEYSKEGQKTPKRKVSADNGTVST